MFQVVFQRVKLRMHLLSICHSFHNILIFIFVALFFCKLGPFSAEEDALIVQRVEEVGLSMGAASK